MVIILDEQIELLKKIVENIDKNKYIVVGGFVDYYHFNRLKFNIDLIPTDIDVVIFNRNTISEFKNLFNNKIIRMNKNRYNLKYKNIILDIFLDTTDRKAEMVNYMGINLFIESIDTRIINLRNFINKVQYQTPINKKNLKYLKKIVYYES